MRLRAGAPSEDSQLNHLGGSEIIILTIGGNDVQFSEFATDCVKQRCDKVSPRSQYTTTEDLIHNTLPGNLARLFGDIAAALGSNTARVLVLGYPYILPLSSQTGINCKYLSSGEKTAATNVQTDLDGAIHSAVTRAVANHEPFEYVDPNGSGSPFDGHQLCSSGSYFNGLDLVNREYSFHPNSHGQAAYAQVVESYLLAHPTAP